MDTINTLSVCMQGIISAGLLMRIIFCAVRLSYEVVVFVFYPWRITPLMNFIKNRSPKPGNGGKYIN